MVLLHNMSKECVKSELDLFLVPLILNEIYIYSFIARQNTWLDSTATARTMPGHVTRLVTKTRGYMAGL